MVRVPVTEGQRESSARLSRVTEGGYDVSPASSGAATPPPVTRRPSGAAESAAANRRWWDDEADRYLEEHGTFLGDTRFVWCPEGLSEADAGLLGDVSGRRVLEIGCGAAQCSRWLAALGADPAGRDLSLEMLRHGQRIGHGAGLEVPLVQADAARLPFGAETFDLAC